MSRRPARLLFCCALLSLAAGCGSSKGLGLVDSVKSFLGLGPARTPLRQLTLAADPGANQGSATQIDIVVAYQDGILERLPKSGPDWFRQRRDLQRSLATGIEVVSVEVPGATAAFKVALPPQIAKGTGVVAFANYVKQDGWAVITLTPYQSAALRLTPDTILVAGH
jgi:type VI secretion system protein